MDNDNDDDNDGFESHSNTIIVSMIMFSLGGDCQPGPQLWHQPASCRLLQVCFELFLIFSLPLKSLIRSHTYIFLKQQLNFFWFKIIAKYWKQDTHTESPRQAGTTNVLDSDPISLKDTKIVQKPSRSVNAYVISTLIPLLLQGIFLISS